MIPLVCTTGDNVKIWADRSEVARTSETGWPGSAYEAEPPRRVGLAATALQLRGSLRPRCGRGASVSRRSGLGGDPGSPGFVPRAWEPRA
jgi:hypothetical protein